MSTDRPIEWFAGFGKGYSGGPYATVEDLDIRDNHQVDPQWAADLRTAAAASATTSTVTDPPFKIVDGTVVIDRSYSVIEGLRVERTSRARPRWRVWCEDHILRRTTIRTYEEIVPGPWFRFEDGVHDVGLVGGTYVSGISSYTRIRNGWARRLVRRLAKVVG